MRVASGTVVNGRVEVAGEPLDEGQRVTVLAPEPEETFELGPEDEAALLLSIAEADRGELIDGDEVLHRIKAL